MDSTGIARIVKWWHLFLTKTHAPSEEDLQIFQNFLGPFDEKNIIEDWKKTQQFVRKVWDYHQWYNEFGQKLTLASLAEKICDQENCPIRKTPIEGDLENNFFNLIVGQRGHLPKGDAQQFSQIILEKLDLSTGIEKAYYHDPYVIRSLTERSPTRMQFTKDYLGILTNKIPSLLIVSHEKAKTALPSSINFKLIEDKTLHDRFVVTFNDKGWSGVLIGSSVTSFPISSGVPEDAQQQHFIIAKLDKEDAIRLGEIIESVFTS